MSIRHLDSLFDPASVVVVGASLRAGSVGAMVWHNLCSGHYQGERFAVNPKYRELQGFPVFSKVSDLPRAPDLALICTPPSTVAGVVKGLAKLGTRAAVVLTAGMNDKQKQAMLQAARSNLFRILGPDSLGLLAPHLGLNASYSSAEALPGELAFVSQSGALVSTMLEWAMGRSIGFSQVVSLGEHADVDIGDLLDYLACDPKTRAILLYTETVDSPRKFMSAARSAARNKPVLILKAGRSRQATTADTLLDSDGVFEAAIARAGLLRVPTLQSLFLAAETLSHFRGNDSPCLTVLSNSGAAGLMAADATVHIGVNLSKLSAVTQQRLTTVLPPGASPVNPVNIPGCAPVTRYVQTLKVLIDDPSNSAILCIHAPTAMVASADIARALLPLVRQTNRGSPRLMGCWLGDQVAGSARKILRGAGIPHFDTPEQAVRAFAMLMRYRQNQQELTQVPAALTLENPLDMAAVKALVNTALTQNRECLTEQEARSVLDACHIPAVSVNQAILPRPESLALRVSSRIDPAFGPVILFGQSDMVMDADLVVALPPLNLPLAQALVSRSSVARLLAGRQGAPAVDERALHHVLIAVSQLLAEIPKISELDINPLIVNFEGAIAQNVRIRLSATAPAGANNFVIRPYPAHLEETVTWLGRTVCLRPIRPEDEAMHQHFLEKLEPEDIRMRVFYSKRTMERSELARLVQIDYAREMAFIATAPGSDGQLQTLGVVRAMIDPDNINAEFGVIVASDLKGKGLGLLLMQKMVAYLCSQGTQRMVATVLDYNERMLKLAKALGFQDDPERNEGPGTRGLFLDLT